MIGRTILCDECISWKNEREIEKERVFVCTCVLLFMCVCLYATCGHISTDCLGGLVVKASAWRAEDPGFEFCLHPGFSGSSHTSDLNIGTPVATLPGARRYRVSAGTGQPGVSILWLGEVESLICNFYLSVAARRIVWADSSLRYTHMLLGC